MKAKALMFKEVPAQFDFPKAEARGARGSGKSNDIYEKSLKQREGCAAVRVLRGAADGQRPAAPRATA